jgi:hypothetical protein
MCGCGRPHMDPSGSPAGRPLHAMDVYRGDGLPIACMHRVTGLDAWRRRAVQLDVCFHTGAI